MAGYDLGTARGTIELVYKGDGTRKAEDDLNRLTKSTQTTGQALDTVGGTAQKAGAAIGAGIAVAVKSAADFESRMSAVKAVSGATAGEMDQLTQKALQLGKETKFSASEGAQAIEELVKAGISVPDVMNGAADATVALAAAGELELPKAAEIAANAMNQFKISASDMPHVADVLAGAANASAVSVGDMGEALNYVGPVAHSAGVSLDDTAAALAILGNNGIKGSAAGTALRGVLLGLTPTTEKQKKAFKELGLITKDGSNIFYDAQGNIKPLGEVMQILNDKTKHLSAQEKATFYEGAFGRNAMTAATILGGETAASFDKMSDSIQKVKAADVAAQRMDNFKGSLEELKGSIETLMIVAGTPLLKVLTDIADALTKFANIMLSLPPGVVELGTKIAALSAGLLLIGGTIMKVIVFIAKFKEAIIALGIASKIGPALAVLRTAMLALAGPPGIIIAAITALITIFYNLYKHNEAFRNFVNGIASAIKDIALKAFDLLKQGVQALVQGFQGVTTATGFVGFLQDVGAAARTLWDALKQLWEVWKTTIWPILKDAASQVWQALKQAWVDMKPALVELWAALKELWNALAPLRAPLLELIGLVAKAVAGFLLWTAKMNLETIVALIKLAAVILEKVAPAITKGAEIIVLIIGKLAAFATKIIEVITKVVEFATKIISEFTRAKDSANSTIGQIITKIGEIATRIATFVTETIQRWTTFWQQFGAKASEAWATVKRYVEAGMAAVKAVLEALFGPIIQSWQTRWQQIKTSAQTHWNEIKTTISTALTAIKAAIDQALAPIKAAIDSAWTAVKTATNTAWEAVKSAVQSKLQAAQSAASSAVNQIKSVVQTAWNAVKSATDSIWSQVSTAIKSKMDAARSAASSGANAIKSVIQTAWNEIKNITNTVWGQLQTVVKSGMDRARSAVQTAANSIKSTVQSAWNSIKQLTEQAWNAVKAATEKAWNALPASVKSAITKVVDAVKGLKDACISAVKDAGTWLVQAGKDLVKGFIDGIQSMIGQAKAKVAELGEVAKQAAKEKLKVSSPSKIFFQYGSFTVQGYIDGVDSLLGKAKSKMDELIGMIKRVAEEKLKLGSPSKVFFEFGELTMRGYIDGLEKWMPTIRRFMDDLQAQWPQVVDTVKRSMSSISSQMSGVDLAGQARQLANKLAPLARDQGGNFRTMISDIGRQLPQINVSAPNIPPIQLPQKMILRVGDREFTAYVDERADALLGQAASLLSRGRK